MPNKNTKRPFDKGRSAAKGQIKPKHSTVPRVQPAPQKPAAPAKQPPATDAAAETLLQLRALQKDPCPTIVVVGGGAAGLAAAITAAKTAPDVRVLLLEKAPRVGRKLLATGNGRCNLTNTDLGAKDYAGADAAALAAFLDGHSSTDTVVWFSGLGLLTGREEDRVYPYCRQAAAVLDVLRFTAAVVGVITLCGCQVTDITDPCRLAVQAGEHDLSLTADRVILAAGGMAAPALGGGADGYTLAKQLGHSCTDLAPGLAALRCRLPAGQTGEKAADLLSGLKGIRANAAVTLYDGNASLAAETGEVQFGEGTLSGIPVLQLSLLLPNCLTPRITVDLLPQLPLAQLQELLQFRCKVPGVTLEDLLLGTVHKKLGYAALKAAGLAPLSRAAAQLTAAETARLAATLKALPFAVLGTAGWESAQTTVGGIPLAELEPQTCRSRKNDWLYLAGEVLDAAGRCGGYNLDWAFTTGRRAGRAAALSLA